MKKNNNPQLTHYKNRIGISIFMLFVIFMIMGMSQRNNAEVFGNVLAFLFFFIFLPLFLYDIYHVHYFKKLKPLHIQKVKLQKVEGVFRYLRFMIEMEIDGKKEVLPTLGIFSSAFPFYNLIDDFSQKEVMCGYDPKKKIAVIVEMLESEQTSSEDKQI